MIARITILGPIPRLKFNGMAELCALMRSIPVVHLIVRLLLVVVPELGPIFGPVFFGIKLIRVWRLFIIGVASRMRGMLIVRG